MEKVDLLDEDKSISGQKFVCLSFISPEDHIKKKEVYFFEEFVKDYDATKSMSKFMEFINFVSFKYNIAGEELLKEFESFIDVFKDKLKDDVSNDYKNFLDKNESELEKQYLKDNDFQTTTRGIKVRGVFPSQEEAELRCKMLRQSDSNHDIYVGPVGIWVPFHPDAYKTGNVNYLEKELNELMHKKKENEEKAKDEFDNRVKESKMNAINDNIEKANKYDVKLTQTINEKGDLISIQNMNTQEKNLGVNASLDEIKAELFKE